MSSLSGVVKQIAIDRRAEVGRVELICSDVYVAKVLQDDLVSRLEIDRSLALNCTVAAVNEKAP